MPTGNDDFRGACWSAPLAAGADGRIALARLDDSIRQSILLIIGTAKGERVMRPTFGCGIHELVFAPNDPTTHALLSQEIRDALIDWEPRVSVLDIQIETHAEDGNKLIITLQYRVRSTNTTFNLVYPFYLEKGQPS
jgi:phage baseplate assembly protein W